MSKRPRHRVLKLRDGSDIIGRVVKVDSEGIVVDRPMMYSIVPVTENGKIKYFSISFRKWFEFAKTQRYYFPKEFIIAHSEPEKELIRDYVQAKKSNDFIDEALSEIDEEDLQGVNIEDILEQLKEVAPDMEDADIGFFGDTGNTASEKSSRKQNNDDDDDIWRGIPRFQ